MAALSDNDKGILVTELNSSGYLFQLAVEHQLDAVVRPDFMEYLIREHPWVDGDRVGFIDLVLGIGFTRMVVECKRPRNGRWIFPVERASSMKQQRIRSRWTVKKPGSIDLMGVDDVLWTPESYESEFCAVRGGGENDKPMLERIAGTLLASTDALAREELAVGIQRPDGDANLYVPMIATAATLYACIVDRNEVELSNGEIAVDRSGLEEVPYIRFRKCLTAQLTKRGTFKDLRSVHEDQERTVLVVNAKYIRELVREMSPRRPRGDPRYPWEIL